MRDYVSLFKRGTILTYTIDNYRWLFIVLLQHNTRLKALCSFFSYDIQHYLIFTLNIQVTLIRILGQQYTRGTSHFLNGTSDFYQESSPGQVAWKNIGKA